MVSVKIYFFTVAIMNVNLVTWTSFAFPLSFSSFYVRIIILTLSEAAERCVGSGVFQAKQEVWASQTSLGSTANNSRGEFIFHLTFWVKLLSIISFNWALFFRNFEILAFFASTLVLRFFRVESLPDPWLDILSVSFYQVLTFVPITNVIYALKWCCFTSSSVNIVLVWSVRPRVALPPKTGDENLFLVVLGEWGKISPCIT